MGDLPFSEEKQRRVMRGEKKWGTRRRGGRGNLSQDVKTRQKKGREGGWETVGEIRTAQATLAKS